MRWAATAIAGIVLLAGCGFDVQSPDLFLLTRTGQGQRLTLLVSDDGTIRCNRGRARTLSDPLLLQARDLASGLGGDAQHNLRLRSSRPSVYHYRIRLQQGTISFPDSATAGGGYPRLAQVEQFALSAAQQACG